MSSLTIEIVRRVFPEVRDSWGKNGKEFNAHCPFGHNKGGFYKLYINADSGTYYCQDCKAHGNAWEKFFESIISSKYGHLRLLRDRDLVPADYRPNRFFASDGAGLRWGEKNPILAPGQTVSLSELSDQHPAFQYLLRRGFNPAEFANPDHPFHALYCTKGQVEVLKGRCRAEARIIFPVVCGGEPVGWTARLIDRVEGEGDAKRRFVWDGRDWHETHRLANGKWSDFEVPKWFHLPSMPKSSLLYNFDQASKYDVGVIAEGPFDIHKIGLFAAGYFGDVPSRHQRRLIMNTWSEVIWIPDAGVDMEKEGVRICLAELREACRVHVFKLNGFDDPGESPREQIWSQIRGRISEV
jgi:hypothetical protein